MYRKRIQNTKAK